MGNGSRTNLTHRFRFQFLARQFKKKLYSFLRGVHSNNARDWPGTFQEFVEGYRGKCRSRHGPRVRYRREFCREVWNENVRKQPEN